MRKLARRCSGNQDPELIADCLSLSERSAKYGAALAHQVAVLGCEGPRALVEAGMVGALMRVVAGKTVEMPDGLVGKSRN